jgi:hypothetical protein
MTPPLTPPDEQHHPRDAGEAGFAPFEDDELAQRLRDLTWPEISPETREHCWKQFKPGTEKT